MSPVTENVIPVVLVTGFLGAGKTTLIKDLLADPALEDTAVVVNEFGDVAIDGDLIGTQASNIIVTSTGCLCCIGSSDVRTSLYELLEAAEDGAAPPFSRVIVETTGLADPAPVVNALIPGAVPAFGLRDHVVARRFRLASVVTCVDVVNARPSLKQAFEAVKQAAFADLIVLTKTDLPQGRRSLASLKKRLAAMNPSASIVDRESVKGAIPALFEGSYVPSDRGEVVGWLALDRMIRSQPGSEEKSKSTRHADDIRALPLVHDGPVTKAALDMLVMLLTAAAGSNFLRLKGLVGLADEPDHPVVVHAVRHLMHPPVHLVAWPNEDRRTRLVVIGRGLNEKAIARAFAALVDLAKVGSRPDWHVSALAVLAALAFALTPFILHAAATHSEAAPPLTFQRDMR